MPKTEMFINYVPGEESRIAIVRDGRLEEFYQERASAESHVGNIYQGKVVNVEPSIQAAFVDFGLERNGFLHISDVHPKYFPGKDREEFERVGSKTPHWERPPIQKCLRRGETVLVQVLKEGIGTKGPTLTSYLSIPGRFLVMMPDMQRTGVSRKVEDDDARREMREILDDLKPPKDFGFIIRTAGIGQTKTELKRDLSYLTRLWKDLERRRKGLRGPGELYTESDLVIRTIRDVFSSDIDRIVVDDLSAARRAHDFLTVASPRSRSKVVYYSGPVPLYDRFGIEAQIESIHARQVPLPSGGSLIIDSAEALVAIDVNSGKSRDARDAETNAYNTNLEAADEICRQLRLRDLGGVVVNDFIDMRSPKHRKSVETRMRDNLKRDRARTRLGMISQFGLLEMTRQRMRGSLKSSVYAPCGSCGGTGHVKTAESVVLDVMRRLAVAMHEESAARIELTISPDVAFHLLNRKRHTLVALEQKFDKPVMVRVGGATVDHVHIAAFDARGGAVDPDRLAGKRDDGAAEHFVEMTGTRSDLEIEEEDDEVAVGADEEATEQRAEREGEAADNADEGRDEEEASASHEARDGSQEQAGGEGEGEGEGGGRRKRRRRRGGRRRRRKGAENGEALADGEQQQGREDEDSRGDDAPREADEPVQVSEAEALDEPAEIQAKLDRGRPKADDDEDREADGDAEGDGPEASDESQQNDGSGGEGQGGRKRRRRRRGRRRGRGTGNGGENAGDNGASEPQNQANGGDGTREPAAPPQAPPPREPRPAPQQQPPRPQSKPAMSRGYSNRVLNNPQPEPPSRPEPGNVRVPSPGDDA